MREGMLWYIDRPEETFAKSIAVALAYYYRKHGRQANRVFVHPEEYNKDTEVPGVQVEPLSSILPQHLWIGVETTKGVTQ